MLSGLLIDGTLSEELRSVTWGLRGGYVCGWYQGKMQRLHRVLMPGAEEVDHINGNRLDNRICNLRACTHAQNMMNKPKAIGVTKRGSRFQAQININKKNIHLGMFPDFESALRVRRLAEKQYFGEFAAVRD